MFYTLGQAAKATGKTKTTIQVAIKTGRLSASKDDLGRYQIDPSELHRVYPLVENEPSGLNEARPQKDPEIQAQFDRLDRMIAFLQSQLEAKDEQIKSITLRLSPPTSAAIPIPTPSTPEPVAQTPEPVEQEPEEDSPEPEINLAPVPNRVSILERFFRKRA
jgi:hypothetical protein